MRSRLTDSNLTETDLTDSLTLIYRKSDGGCYFNSPFIGKFLDYSNFAQLLAEQLSKKLPIFIYFIEVLLVHPGKPKRSVHTSANLIFHFSNKNGKGKYYLSLSYLHILKYRQK